MRVTVPGDQCEGLGGGDEQVRRHRRLKTRGGGSVGCSRRPRLEGGQGLSRLQATAPSDKPKRRASLLETEGIWVRERCEGESIFSLWSDLVEKCSTVFGAHIGSSSITRRIANLPSQSELQVWQHNDTGKACCQNGEYERAARVRKGRARKDS